MYIGMFVDMPGQIHKIWTLIGARLGAKYIVANILQGTNHKITFEMLGKLA